MPRSAIVAVLLVGLLVVSSSIAGPTTPDAGVTDRDQTEINSCTVIDTPGRYELTSDIDAGREPCVEITASDVVVVGNGHLIRGERFAPAEPDVL